MELVPGTCIERYVVEARMQAGVLATSYRVRHTTLETLHLLMVQNGPAQALRNRLVAGARIQARLRHPHVVAATDVLDLGGFAAVVLDHVEGATLEEVITSHDLTEAEVDSLAHGLFEGVGWLYQNGVVHRNLKSRNVLVDLAGPAVVPKVTDFTLARVLGEPVPPSKKAPRVFGTPEFMAPEQTVDSDAVDHRADVWSLGVVLYHLCTGRLPFDGPDSASVIALLRTGRYATLRDAAPGTPPRWAEAVRAALVVDPKERAPSPEAVAELWFGGSAERPKRLARNAPVGRVTLVFTDIEGSTRIWESRPELARNALRAHDAVMRSTLHRHGGYEVKTEGDAFMIAFPTALNAVKFCLDAQRQLHDHPWSPELLALPEAAEAPGFRGVRVRMGVHVGEPEVRADGDTVDYFGPMVNRAARVSQAGHGGQILVSGEVWDAVGKAAEDVAATPLGRFKLKGLDGAQYLVQVLPSELAERWFPAVRAAPA
jgi:class 3 adenylate cyclase